MTTRAQTKSRYLIFIALIVSITIPSLRWYQKGQFYLENLRPGQVLVANPSLSGSLFKNARVLLISTTETGATGVVLGEPISEGLIRRGVEISAHLEERSLKWGGPVAMDQLFHLVPSEKLHDYALIPSKGLPLKTDLTFYTFAGYTGWSKGQLEMEIIKGDWRVYQPTQNELSNWLSK
ncbi:MAG: YqgE/AlgH family protein [Pseudomonadales bacterium]|nr:YqgE/AlgH family protein [Pseudomonadales bacterium]